MEQESLAESFSADWRCQGTNLKPIHFDALPTNPLVSFKAVKIQLPVDFIPELDRIEAFYDLHLQELVPFTVGDGETVQSGKHKPSN